MKSKIKLLIIGIVVLCLLFAAYFLAVKWNPETNDEDDSQLPSYEVNYLFKENIEDVSSIEIHNGENVYTIHNGEEATITGYKSHVIDSSKLYSTLVNLCSIVEAHPINANSDKLEDYGVLNSDKYITVNMKDKSLNRIILGNNAYIENEFYAYNEKTKKIATVNQEVANIINADPNMYRSLDICSIDYTKITSLSVSKGNKKIISFEIDEEKGPSENMVPNFKMLYPYKNVPASSDRAVAFLEKMGDMQADSIAEENPASLSKYGLDEPYNVSIVHDGEKHLFSLGNKNENGLVYMMYNNIKVVYLVNCPFYDNAVNANAYDYIDRYIHLVNINDVESIDFKAGDTHSVLKIEGDTANDNATYYIDNEKVRTDKFKKLYQAIIGITAISLEEFSPSDKEIASITFNLKDNKTKIFKYYTFDDRRCYVKADNGIGCLTLKKNIDSIIELVK